MICIFLIFLSETVSAKEYVYLKIDGNQVGFNSVYLYLDKGQSYTFEGSGSAGVDEVLLYVKNGVSDRGEEAEITFTPDNEETYQLDIIGFASDGTWEASQKFYLIIREPELPPEEEEEPCIESWSCSDWSECINGIQTRTCKDLNDCGITKNKPKEEQSCEDVQDDFEFNDEITTDCGSYDETDFDSICDYIKCKRETHTFETKSGMRIKIGFMNENIPNSDGMPVSDSEWIMNILAEKYNQYLGQKDIAIIYNLNDRKAYIFYGKESDRVRVGELVNSKISRSAFREPNNVCDAFNYILKELGAMGKAFEDLIIEEEQEWHWCYDSNLNQCTTDCTKSSKKYISLVDCQILNIKGNANKVHLYFIPLKWNGPTPDYAPPSWESYDEFLIAAKVSYQYRIKIYEDSFHKSPNNFVPIYLKNFCFTEQVNYSKSHQVRQDLAKCLRREMGSNFILGEKDVFIGYTNSIVGVDGWYSLSAIITNENTKTFTHEYGHQLGYCDV